MQNLIARYNRAKENIENNEKLKSKILEYRALQAAMQEKQEPISFEDERMISSLYWSLMLNDDARDFLESERELVTTVCAKMDEICEDVDLSFL